MKRDAQVNPYGVVAIYREKRRFEILIAKPPASPLAFEDAECLAVWIIAVTELMGRNWKRKAKGVMKVKWDALPNYNSVLPVTALSQVTFSSLGHGGRSMPVNTALSFAFYVARILYGPGMIATLEQHVKELRNALSFHG